MIARNLLFSVRRMLLALGLVAVACCWLFSSPLEAAGLEPTPTPVLVPVSWGELATFPLLDRTDLPEQVADLLADLPLPVLLPADPELLDRAIVTRQDQWYAASIPSDGITIYLRGSRRAFAVEGLEMNPEAWERGYLLTRNQHIASLSFVAFQVGYLIEVECADPLGDPRCTEDDYILGLLGRLALVVNQVVARQPEVAGEPTPSLDSALPSPTGEPPELAVPAGGEP
ncbi:MAG: hypothetical protein JW797_09820 [Bradymonadales bacterium]|nr:hypothetical protein [Bradymonadales bacterium]